MVQFAADLTSSRKKGGVWSSSTLLVKTHCEDEFYDAVEHSSSAMVQFAMDISSFDRHDNLPDSEEFHKGPWVLKEGDKRETKRKRKKQQKACRRCFEGRRHLHSHRHSYRCPPDWERSLSCRPPTHSRPSVHRGNNEDDFLLDIWMAKREGEDPPSRSSHQEDEGDLSRKRGFKFQ